MDIQDKLDLIIHKLEDHDKKFDRIDERFEKIDERLDRMDERFDKMDDRFGQIEEEVHTTKLVMENEIRTNIMRVAEGHLDLSRNLQEAIKRSKEVEYLSIRVGILESEMKELKRGLH